ncbi:hypothetical protein [Bradyrhizobium sp. AZCC 2230]|uniref:hypothetical protein n=1 Tax=Bradyrhizobium sp. AZCC 2230 TaxID=3117021 RepID=UPI002FEEECF0
MMVKTEVSVRVSSWLFFLNRSGLIGKRGNIPSGERVAGWRKWGRHGAPVCFPMVIASAAKQSRSFSADAFLDCFAALAMTGRTVKVFCPTAQAIFRFIGTTGFIENNPMHSRTVVDFKEEIVGWAKRSVPTSRARFGDMVGTARCAFAHPTGPSYSAAICLGAGGGLAKSAASWA